MGTISYNGGRCANCGREPVAIGIPVFRNPAIEGQGGVDTAIWCIDCVRQLLHQEGEDETVAGG